VSEKSVYLEVGLNAHEVSAGPSRRVIPKQHGNTNRLVRFGHDFQFDSLKGKKRDQHCRWCRKPRFVIDGKPCKARKK
jgi:hypothetical protein